MANFMFDAFYGFTAATTGAAAGWWFCRRSYLAAENRQRDEQQRWARAVVGRLSELTSDVASSVGEHSSRLREITEDLQQSAANDPDMIVAAIAKLVGANERLEDELAKTEEKLRQQAQEIERQMFEARTDPLTGLANRRAFDDEIKRRAAESSRHRHPFSLLVVNVDHFREFRETYGRDAGDEILKGVAQVLRQQTRVMDLPVRYGDEEFVVVMPSTDMEAGGQAAVRLQQMIEQQRFHSDGRDFRITVSIGVAQFQPGERSQNVVRRADRAVQHARSTGGNVCWYCDGTAVFQVGEARETPTGVESAPNAETDEPLPSGITSPDDGADRQTSNTPDVAQDSDESTAGTTAAPRSATKKARSRTVATVIDRPGFCQQIRRRLELREKTGQPCSVLFVQIDNVEKLRRSDGKTVIDKMEARLSDLLQDVAEKGDLLARYREGCFALLLKKGDLQEATDRAARVHGEFSQQGDTPKATVSVVATSAQDNDGLVDVVKRMELGLEFAQSSGGNMVAVHSGKEVTQAVGETKNFLPQQTAAEEEVSERQVAGAGPMKNPSE